MDDNNQATTLSNDPAVNAPDTATLGRDKGKATQDPAPTDTSMDEGESDESENEDIVSWRNPRHPNLESKLTVSPFLDGR